MNDINKNEQKSSRFISLGACTVDAILKVDHIPSGDAKIMAEDGVVIGAGMAVAAASASLMASAFSMDFYRTQTDYTHTTRKQRHL